MPNDYLKKQPTKTEKMMYDLYMHQDQLSRSLWTTTSFVTALGMLMKVDPEEIAKLLTTDHAKIKEYSDKVNSAITEIEKKQKESGQTEAGHEDHGHTHDDHDHSHE